MGTPTGAPVIWWARQDLRLADNAALRAAIATGRPVLAVFVLDDAAAGAWALGGASRWWLHGSLASLASDLAACGSPLILRRGDSRRIIAELAEETGAEAVFAGRLYEPWARARDKEVAAALKGRGIAIHGERTSLLFEPWEIATKQGGAYSVYTPFSRACFDRGPPDDPAPAPRTVAPLARVPESDRLEDWALLPGKPDWAAGLRDTWTPGEAGAAARLKAFVARALATYDEHRNRPDMNGTSGLSPHLHWGEISPATVWHATRAAAQPANAPRVFLQELLWREFSHHLLWHRPEMPEQPLKPGFDAFPWRNDHAARIAWQRGRTGYPIVDAGMRQLWQTGWMHNRVRMIVASFLVKHLLLPWQEGEAWFWDTLVDADLAANSASWQWVAGSGADAAPYFRIFNPVLQGEKFDPDGTYVRRFVPELARLPSGLIHKPWQAAPLALSEAGVTLGRTYPAPIVEHGPARARALRALEAVSADNGAA